MIPLVGMRKQESEDTIIIYRTMELREIFV